MLCWRSSYIIDTPRRRKSSNRKVCFSIQALLTADITLIINLLLSDIVQAIGFIISYRWAANGDFEPDSALCSAQGAFVQMGDLVTALFVIMIALHTLKHFITPTNPRLPDKLFKGIIAAVWIVALGTAIIPRLLEKHFYEPVGVWCWIAPRYIWPRLYLHYFYLFLAEATSIFIYGGLGIYLWCYSSRAGATDLRRAARTMFMYPITYTIGTLPLAAARVQSMRKQHVTAAHLVAVCIIFSTLGGINCAVYVLTRRHLIMEPSAQKKERSYAERSRTETLACMSPAMRHRENTPRSSLELDLEENKGLFHTVSTQEPPLPRKDGA